jgi:hypothetical protein
MDTPAVPEFNNLRQERSLRAPVALVTCPPGAQSSAGALSFI